MKLHRLWIDRFKNLRNSEVRFEHPYLLNAAIGGNGSGKSNLLEAILHILIDVYLNKVPPFGFSFEYEAQGRTIELSTADGRVHALVDGQAISLGHFTRRLRDGDAQVYYPETTFAYYSGDCDRIQRLLQGYNRSFRRMVQEPDRDNFQPLFVHSSNQQAKNILLALIAHRHTEFLQRLKISGARKITLVVQSPKGFDPDVDEPVLWGTSGKVRKIVAALEETADYEQSQRVGSPSAEDENLEGSGFREIRRYSFREAQDPDQNLWELAKRLERGRDNLYLALEHLAARGILKSVKYELTGENGDESFDFDELSEGEKQLIAVIGAVRLTNQRDNLLLLDEPDTHLNPQWSWEYHEMLDKAFDRDQRAQSTVLMATHDPVVISGLVRQQVFLADATGSDKTTFDHPVRNPRGQGIANLLCSSEFFGLPSSLDKTTQVLMDERLILSMKDELSEADRLRLKELNELLEFLKPGISERDPDYVAFLRSRHADEIGA